MFLLTSNALICCRLFRRSLSITRLTSMDASTSDENVGGVWRLKRHLKNTNDIYMAHYDPDFQQCIPISNPNCGDVEHFLPLPYQNVSRYSKIHNFLTKISRIDSFSYTEFTRGVQSYVGEKLEFDGLRKFLEQMTPVERLGLNDLLRFMANLALELNQENFERIPLLKTGKSKSLTMSQRQAAILLSNGFFCTFEDSLKHRNGKYNSFSFVKLFSLETFKCVEKLKCAFAYFRTIQGQMPNGVITILRQVCPRIRFEHMNPRLCNIQVDSEGYIERQVNEAHVDFANCLIGGGVLSGGAVQEEIRFIISPETLISCLICERMDNNDAILILGAQQYSNYKGYRKTFEYEPRDNSGIVERTQLGHSKSCIIAIDAVQYDHPERQYTRGKIDREIRKAFTGFAIELPDESKVVATGNWGCGAFNGNMELKFLIQFIAASAAGRDLHYFTFKEKELTEKIENLLQKLQEGHVSFELLYARLIEGGPRPHGDFILNPFDYILERTSSVAPKKINHDYHVISMKKEQMDCQENGLDPSTSNDEKMDLELAKDEPNSNPSVKKQTTLDTFFKPK